MARIAVFGITVVALVLGLIWRGGEVDAGFEPRAVSFYVELQEGAPHVVGTVPVGRRLVLKDFIMGETRNIRILVDGKRVASMRPPTDGTSLCSGVVIEGGELSVELVQGFGTFELTVCGVLE